MKVRYCVAVNPMEILHASWHFLDAVLKEGDKNTPDGNDLDSTRANFVYRHGVTVARLGSDMEFLYTQRRYLTASLAARSILESWFMVAASHNNRLFHLERILGEFEGDMKKFAKNFEADDADIIAAVASYKAQADDLTNSYGNMISAKRWTNLREVAKAANLDKVYTTEYFFLSAYAHGTLIGTMRQSVPIGIGFALQSGVYALINVGNHVAQAMNMNDRAAQEKEAVALKAELDTLSAANAFRALDRQ
jgi:hypothetical protein